MHPTDYPTGWDHPATRSAWIQHMGMIVGRLAGWSAVWFGSLFLIVATPVWIAWIFLPILVYAGFRALVQVFYFPWSMNIQRVLAQYPWQLLSDVPHGRDKHPQADKDEMWFEFSNPEEPNERIPLLFLSQMRTYWWMRRFGTSRTKPELKAEIEPLWFAGDPRFYSVIAAPGRGGQAPKRLHFLYQRSARRSWKGDVITWDASPAALECARRAGARVPDRTVPPQPRPNS
ncbi:hypothetical protein [Streptomyces sp. NPDC059009]|uniref:hypothetical protein n=1 Tax=Streptomyces sp. NPDC059009 TaxID=3346694 RepID=UPI0036C99D94